MSVPYHIKKWKEKQLAELMYNKNNYDNNIIDKKYNDIINKYNNKIENYNKKKEIKLLIRYKIELEQMNKDTTDIMKNINNRHNSYNKKNIDFIE